MIEVACIGCPNALKDPTLSGEVHVAFVSLKDGSKSTEIKDKLMELVEKSLSVK